MCERGSLYGDSSRKRVPHAGYSSCKLPKKNNKTKKIRITQWEKQKIAATAQRNFLFCKNVPKRARTTSSKKKSSFFDDIKSAVYYTLLLQDVVDDVKKMKKKQPVEVRKNDYLKNVIKICCVSERRRLYLEARGADALFPMDFEGSGVWFKCDCHQKQSCWILAPNRQYFRRCEPFFISKTPFNLGKLLKVWKSFLPQTEKPLEVLPQAEGVFLPSDSSQSSDRFIESEHRVEAPRISKIWTFSFRSFFKHIFSPLEVLFASN